jgi:hypothetical protein
LPRRRAFTGPPDSLFKAFENGALLGNCGTFSRFTPQSGHFTRYTSMNTVV